MFRNVCVDLCMKADCTKNLQIDGCCGTLMVSMCVAPDGCRFSAPCVLQIGRLCVTDSDVRCWSALLLNGARCCPSPSGI